MADRIFYFARCLCLLFVFYPVTAWGDVVHRIDGRKVTGTIDFANSDVDYLVVRLKYGSIRIPRREVRSYEADVLKTDAGKTDKKSESPERTPRSRNAEMPARKPMTADQANVSAEEEYARQAASLPLDTADGQFEVAIWCVNRRLRDKYEEHLRKAIEIDPDHIEARRRLGYEKVDGRWLTQDEAKAAQGYVKYKGKYLLPQEVEQLELQQEQQKVRKEYFSDLRRWQLWLRGRDEVRKREASTSILALDDVAVLSPLIEIFGDRGTVDERRLLIEALEKFDDPLATRVLFKLAIDDEEANRAAAVDVLVKRKSPELIAEAIRTLRSPQNPRILAAAVLLAALNDQSAVPALIDVLITRHQRVVEPTWQELASPSRSFKPTRTIITDSGQMIRITDHEAIRNGLQGGAPSTRVFIDELRNQPVLEALVELTGQNFGYDKQQWLHWLKTRPLMQNAVNQ